MLDLSGLKDIKFKEPKDVKMTALVKNVTEGSERFVVAKVDNTDLWYWGRWDDYDRAKEVAEEVGGIVLEDK